MKSIRKYTPDEDSPLLDSWHRGEIISFETLVWKYLKRIYNLSYLLSGDEECARVATESAFVSAYSEIASLRSTSRFSTWLAGLAIKETRKQADIRDVTTPATPVVMEESSGNRNSRFQSDLRGYITALAPEMAEVIVLRYVRGYSLERMSEILQIRTESIIPRLFDAQEMLAEQLKKRDGIFSSGLAQKKGDSPPHPEIRSSLPTYLDNAADEADKETIRKHLGGCGSCREALAELEWLVEHLKSIPDLDPPQSLTASIMYKIRLVSPHEKKRATRSFSPGLILILMVGSLLTLSGISWYILDQKKGGNAQVSSSAKVTKQRPSIPLQEADVAGARPLLPSRLPMSGSARRGGERSEEGNSSALLPEQPKSPALQTEAGGLLQAEQKTAIGQKPDTAIRKKGVEANPQLPQEWGESIPADRAPPKKATVQKNKSGEVAVLLETDDPVGSLQEIEQAVIGVGGNITGRAFGSGKDILYTQIESDKFFELMKRFRQIGKILELPQIPEEVPERIDLVIRW